MRRSIYTDAHGVLHVNGFAMALELQEPLWGLKLLELQPTCARTLQVVSHESKASSSFKAGWRKRRG